MGEMFIKINDSQSPTCYNISSEIDLLWTARYLSHSQNGFKGLSINLLQIHHLSKKPQYSYTVVWTYPMVQLLIFHWFKKKNQMQNRCLLDQCLILKYCLFSAHIIMMHSVWMMNKVHLNIIIYTVMRSHHTKQTLFSFDILIVTCHFMASILIFQVDSNDSKLA